jgi:hypothetical protein
MSSSVPVVASAFFRVSWTVSYSKRFFRVSSLCNHEIDPLLSGFDPFAYSPRSFSEGISVIFSP